MSLSETEAVARACADSMYARDVAAQAVGINLDEVKPGYARLQMTVRADMLNGHNVCHGGFLFVLADTAFAYACNSYNRVTYAQSCDIDFVQAGREGDQLIAIAEERRRGGKTGVYDVVIQRGKEDVLAYFRGRSYEVKGEVIRK